MGKDRGVISLAGGYSSQGEAARLVRGKDSSVREVWLGGQRWVSERRLKTEIKRKYGK